MNLENLKFPIGKFQFDPDITSEEIQEWITTIRSFPEKMKAITKSLTEAQLNWHYRPDGWTIKQVVHHCADSHINSFVRFKLTLTEDTPTIRPYEEQLWAELPDSITNDLSASLKILEGVHQRWSIVLQSLTEKDYEKMYFHPSNQKLVTLKEAIGLYAWHCEHHLAHIEQALHYKGVF